MTTSITVIIFLVSIIFNARLSIAGLPSSAIDVASRAISPIPGKCFLFHKGRFAPRTRFDSCVNTLEYDSQAECVSCSFSNVNGATPPEIAASRFVYLFSEKLATFNGQQLFKYPTSVSIDSRLPTPLVLASYTIGYRTTDDTYRSEEKTETSACERTDDDESLALPENPLYHCVRANMTRNRLRTPKVATFQFTGRKILNEKTIRLVVKKVTLENRRSFATVFSNIRRPKYTVDAEKAWSMQVVFRFQRRYLTQFRIRC